MRTVSTLLCLAVVVESLLGCATSRRENPVIEENSGGIISRNGVGVIATTADRRVVVIDKASHRFCAEPSPDVAEAILSTFTASIDASASGKDDSQTIQAAFDAKVDIAKNLKTSNSQLLQRTQGIQFIRDGLFALCQQRINGWIQADQNKNNFENIVGEGAKLISHELDSRERMMPYLVRMEEIALEKARLQRQENGGNTTPAKAEGTK